MPITVRGDPVGYYYYRRIGLNGRFTNGIEKANPCSTHFGFVTYQYPYPMGIAGWVDFDFTNVPGYKFAERKARNDLVTETRSMMDQLLLGSDIIYAKSTLEVAVNRARSLLNLCKRIKKLDARLIKDFQRGGYSEIPSIWLEINFVAKPLIGSINTCIELLNNPFAYQRFRYRKNIGEFYQQINTGPGEYVTLGVNAFMYCNGYVRMGNLNKGLFDQMGLTDFIGIAWDMLPWSWAIDYFTNMGDYFGNLNPKYDSLEFAPITTHGTNLKAHVVDVHKSGPHWVTGICDVYQKGRIVGRPVDVEFILDCSLNTRKFSYLMSAIGLTLKGKFK